jgi:hypothetical protein
MNDNTIDRDRADEEILTYEVPDEALEAAAGTGARETFTQYTFHDHACCF